MRLISCRKNFTDQNEFVPTPDKPGVSALQVSWNGGSVFRAPDQHDVFAVQRDYAELVQVHGYNTEACNVCDAYRSNSVIAGEEGVVAQVTGFLWPGLGETWLESLLFHRAQRFATAAAPFFAEYVKNFAGRKLTVMTHSLGARVVLEALLHYDIAIDALALTGPAVDYDCFEPGKAYADCVKKVGRLMVFYSNNDPVLGRMYRDDQFHFALGHSGPRTSIPGVAAFDMSATVHAHGGYRYDRSMWRKLQISK